MQNKQIKIGSRVFARLPTDTFHGTVVEARDGWVRVAGKGSIADTYYNEWFRVSSKCCNVTTAHPTL